MKNIRKIRKSYFSKNTVDTIITLLILLIADNPIVVGNKKFRLLVFAILVVVFVYYKYKIDPKIFLVLLVIALITFLQGYNWGYSIFTLVTYSIFVVLMPYLAVKITGIKYLSITASALYVISIYSTVFYLGQVFIPGFTSFLMKIEAYFRPFSSLDVRPSIFIYSIATNTVEEGTMSNILRNAGMFHEPGAFAVFIDLALSVNLLIKRKLLTKNNAVLLVALATTFSTAGYLAAILIISVFIFTQYYNTRKRALLLPFILIILIGTYYLFQLPFMGDKIQQKVTMETNASLNTTTSGRIMGARKALLVLGRYPFTGRGLIQASRSTDASSEEAASYGYMYFFSQFGIVVSIIYLIFFINGMKRISYYFSGHTRFWMFIFAGLLINLFSQKFMADAFFMMIFYIGLLNQYSVKNIYNRHHLN